MLGASPQVCACRRYVDSFALKRSNQFIPPDTTTFLVDTDEYNLQVCELLWNLADMVAAQAVLPAWPGMAEHSQPEGWVSMCAGRQYLGLLSRPGRQDQGLPDLPMMHACRHVTMVLAWQTLNQADCTVHRSLATTGRTFPRRTCPLVRMQICNKLPILACSRVAICQQH